MLMLGGYTWLKATVEGLDSTGHMMGKTSGRIDYNK